MYKCKKCESNEYVKAGFVKAEQRYKCKKCGCQFMPCGNKSATAFFCIYNAVYLFLLLYHA